MTMTDTIHATDWFEPGISFKCTQCGNCCSGPSGYVWFDDEEAVRIAEYLGLEENEFRRRFARRKFGRWTLDEIKRGPGNYDCVFLRRDEEGKSLCSIYPVRPVQCRTWPFWPENMASPKHWQRAAQTCPGMQHGGNFVPADRIRILIEQTRDT